MLVKFLFLISFLVSAAAWSVSSQLSYEFRDSINQPINKNGVNNWFSVDVQSKKPQKRNDGYFEAGARYFYTADMFMYSAPEVYFIRENSTNRLIFGRKIIDWNKYEQFWGLNHINAQRSYDLLDDKPEGPIGIFYEQTLWNRLKTSLFLSYVYIPQLNPSIKVKDGKITSPSDSVVYPSKLEPVEGGPINPIVYDLNQPKWSDVVFQKSLGFNLAYDYNNFSLSTYALYKPENKLRINARGSLNGLNSYDEAEVIAQPFVNYHGVYGLLTGYQNSFTSNFLGVEIIDANTELDNIFKSIDPLKVEPQQRPEKKDVFDIRPSYVAQTYLHYTTIIPRDTYSISLNYIRLLSNESVQKDSFFQEASHFIDAVGIGGNLSFTDHFSTLVKWYYDFKRQDNIVKTEIGWNSKSYGLVLGLEVLSAPDSESYWSNFRTNDSVYSKFSIVF